MSGRNNRKYTYLTDEEAAQLSEWADETGKSESHLLREAILEYLDNDRTARIEDRLDEIEAKIDALPGQLQSDTTHTHKPDTPMSQAQATPATEKARDIIRRLQHEIDNPDGIVQVDDLDLAIEDIAGADRRTLQKYKRIVRKRGLLFEHPGEPPIWTLQSDQWLSWMEDYLRLNGADDAEDVVADYPATVTQTPDGFALELTEVEADA
jgi:hypothetical protein